MAGARFQIFFYNRGTIIMIVSGVVQVCSSAVTHALLG